MKFKDLQPARLLRRYKRFLADVELPNGQQMTVHCPNTGAMTGCDEPGSRIWLQPSDNPKRKYRYTWTLVETAAGDLVCIHSALANTLVAEALAQQRVDALRGYVKCQPEFKLPGGERIDFLLSDERQRCLVEVKCVTLLGADGGLFPDAISKRATRHLDALMAARAQGDRAVLLFACLHTGIESVAAAADIDPVYAERLRQAQSAGVEVSAWSATISPREMRLGQPLPLRAG